MLVDQLLNQRYSEDKPAVVSIVGNGGQGKTALAQLVFHESRIVNYFDKRIWISLCGSFDELKYTKEILRYLDSDVNMDGMNLNLLQETLQMKLEGQRVLLVLDDMCIPEQLTDYMNTKRWAKFVDPLSNVRCHIKILVTTRMRLVADLLDSVDVCVLGALCKEDSIALFEASALSNGNLELYPTLSDLGIEIINRLNGYPLAIKVVGSLLSGQLDSEAWRQVLDIDLSKDVDIMTILRLSYNRLPEHLKKCFAYCSLFPKNWSFCPEDLGAQWAALGYIEVTSSWSELKITSATYFQQLVSRSFFQPIQTENNEVQYSMHDLLNDLAVYITAGEFLRVEGSSCPTIPLTVRHLCITDTALERMKDKSVLQRLKTFYVLPDYSEVKFGAKSPDHKAALRKLRSVRVLHLHYGYETRAPDVFSRFVHLRYLSMFNVGNPLPPSMAVLYHLQTLFHYGNKFSGSRFAPKWLARCVRLSAITFPKGITNLSNLLVICVEKHPINLKGGRHPALIGHIGYAWSHFSVFDPVMVECNPQENDNWKADWIMNPNGLTGTLVVKIPGNVGSIEEASRLQLVKNFRALILQWVPSNKQVDSRDLLTKLRPAQILQVLIMENYPGRSFPDWLCCNKFEILRHIELLGCEQCEQLPSLGDLPSLLTLNIYDMRALKKIGPEFYGSMGFPSLVTAEFQDFRELEEICQPDNSMKVFPSLRSFILHDFPKLVKVPFWCHLRWKCTFGGIEVSWMLMSSSELSTQDTPECFIGERYDLDVIWVQRLSLDSFDFPVLYKILGMHKCIIEDSWRVLEIDSAPT